MKKVLVSILSLALLAGCKKKEVVGPQGPVGPEGPSFVGNIRGHVSIFDQYGGRVVYNYLPIQVSLSGIGSVGADSVGFYHFDSVTTGNYRLSVSGDNFGATVVNGVNMLKDTLFQPVTISQKPTFNISTLIASRSTLTTGVQLDLELESDSRLRNCIVFVGKTPDVSADAGTYLLSYTIPIQANRTKVIYTIPVDALNNARIFFGEVVYFAAYSYVVGDASAYVDPATGNYMYTAIGARIADSTMAP